MMIIKRCTTEGVLFHMFDVLQLFDNLHHIQSMQWQSTILSIAIESQYLATKLYRVDETVRKQFQKGYTLTRWTANTLQSTSLLRALRSSHFLLLPVQERSLLAQVQTIHTFLAQSGALIAIPIY